MKLLDISTPKYPNTFAQVDAADYDWLARWKWYVVESRCGGKYAGCHLRRGGSGSHGLMHRMILKAPAKTEVDHKDGNGLNNQTGNLRLCTHAENGWNARRPTKQTTKYRGVYLNGAHIRACISVNKKYLHLGYFKTQEDAAKAYNEAAKKYHGEFATLNEVPLCD